MLKIFRILSARAIKNTHESEQYFVNFGIILIIGFLGFYGFNLLVGEPQGYENLFLRITIGILGLCLIFKDYWPQWLRAFMPLYWYFTLLYALPFFFSFMLFKNPTSITWHINGLVGLVILTLFVDWISYSLLVLLGVALSLIVFYMTTSSPELPKNLLATSINYASPTIYFMLFARKKDKIIQEKLGAMKALSGAIAHELRTPLSAVKAGALGLRKFMPKLLETYQLARKAHLPVEEIDQHHFEILSKLADNIESEAQSSFTFIDMLLVKITEPALIEVEICSMQHCLEEALRRYPFSEPERKLIHLQTDKDFFFKCNELLIVHVLFNLLKNALHYIKVAGKGEIFISLEAGSRENYLHFKDTGTGISPALLPHIFERFFSKTKHGTGIGLAFCKTVMQELGGDIICSSEEGKHTEFILIFPTSLNSPEMLKNFFLHLSLK